MIPYRLIWILLPLLMFVTHVASRGVKCDSSQDSVPVAQINVQVSLGGNSTSNGLMSRKMLGMKGEKGDRGKAGPPGRPVPENKCSFNCCSRLEEIEEKLSNLTAVVNQLMSQKAENETQSTTKKSNSDKESGYTSCKVAKQLGQVLSGVYTLDLGDGLDSFQVYCDMSTDGGGWTVFQRRQDGSVDFYRGWSDYKNGFGDLNGEFWLGLDKIHRLTKQAQTLRVDLMDFSGRRTHADYRRFQISDESSKYSLTFTSFSGNASDALSYHNGMAFTTKDNDNDKWGAKCAKNCNGAWWYNKCYYSNLNGLYLKTANSQNKKGIVWTTSKHYYPLKFVEMKLAVSS
ncbi:ficolin-2-like [Corticium candelabrum]|uniref:ficolin-2-like n=1 Tax=Corticium candelabrum TaxID=121492 RepID=UPI002E25887E|nr:ficolin-2-like [Corticium candelabrum]